MPKKSVLQKYAEQFHTDFDELVKEVRPVLDNPDSQIDVEYFWSTIGDLHGKLAEIISEALRLNEAVEAAMGAFAIDDEEQSVESFDDVVLALRHLEELER